MFEIRDERDEGRFGAYLDGRLVGRAAWVLVRRTVMLPHVRVDAECRDLGIGSLLAERIFADARVEGCSVLPLCPYMRRWAEQHPDYRGVARGPRPGEIAMVRSAVAAAELLKEMAVDRARRGPGSAA